MKRVFAWIRRDHERGQRRLQANLERERLRCVRCRHDLTGLTIELCPECGAPMHLRERVWTDGRWHLAWLLGWTALWIAVVAALHLAGEYFLARAHAQIPFTGATALSNVLQAQLGLQAAVSVLCYLPFGLAGLAAYGVSSTRHGLIRVAAVAAMALGVPWVLDYLTWFYSGGTISLWP